MACGLFFRELHSVVAESVLDACAGADNGRLLQTSTYWFSDSCVPCFFDG
jgi:hypothetical protein